MAKGSSARKRAIRRRNIFIACCVAVMVVAITSVTVIVVEVVKKSGDNKPSTKTPSVSEPNNSTPNIEEPLTENPSNSTGGPNNTTNSEPTDSNQQQFVDFGDYTLDANYTDLLLVNGENPLPADYDYESRLVTIDKKYLNGWRNQIREDVYPYARAMCEAAWKDGVDLYILSPYRSYSSQETLFNNQVQKQINNGVDPERAEDVAATIVARPGTSEHHTGIAIDFNMADQAFEGTKECLWLMEHADEYGFILRYPEDKTDITGVIYEAWHYRFVGINEAKKIKKSGLCLEEYLEKYY